MFWCSFVGFLFFFVLIVFVVIPHYNFIFQFESREEFCFTLSGLLEKALITVVVVCIL